MSEYTKTIFQGHTFPLQGVSLTESSPVCLNETQSWSNTVTGNKQTNWRQKIKLHQNATSLLIASEYKVTSVPGVFSAKGYINAAQLPIHLRNVNFAGATCGSYDPFITGVVPVGSAANEAAGDWYGKVRNALSRFKGSVFAAESTQARRMMWTRAQQMINMIPPWQRRLNNRWRGKGSRRAKLKALSDSWIELQFGWLPLASDIEDAYTVLQNPTPEYKRVKGEGMHRVRQSHTSGDAVFGAGTIMRERNEFTEYKVKYYGEVKARADPTGDKLLDFGLGVREFAPTAWEVIPWSFAVDYFTNVGEIVTALSYASADVSWCSRDTIQIRIRDWTATHELQPSIIAGAQVLINIPSSFKGEAKSIVRQQAANQVPIPSLRWQLPSWKQGLNLAALAVSRRLRLFH